jgi:hypothetical protein
MVIPPNFETGRARRDSIAIADLQMKNSPIDSPTPVRLLILARKVNSFHRTEK